MWNGPQQWSWSIHGTTGPGYTPSPEVQSTTASRNNDIFERLTKRTRGASQRSSACYMNVYIYTGEVSGAVEWRQIKLKTLM